MNLAPETRASLLLRVRDPSDQAAWQEFVAIYRPVILRLALRKGMQPADADDVAQQVLVNVARAIERRAHDPTRAKFRTWLRRVTENAILNALSRHKPDRGAGGSGAGKLLGDREAPAGPDTDLMRLEHRRELFRWAARQIRTEFQADTWNAFWLTAVESQQVDAVARQLGKNRGSIYAARSRIIRRLQEKIAEYEQD